MSEFYFIDDPASRYRHVPVKAPIERIRTWLRTCETRHGQLCRQHKNNFLPSRLLDLDPRLGQGILKLVETKTFIKPATYVALSYCWGGEQPANLVRERLQKYHSAIDSNSLPRSVQDAVYVARALGSRYLWIDAYCILQDCAADKAAEIGRMGHIYRNARLTIIVSGSAKVTDGIPTQKLHDYPIWPIPLVLPDATAGIYHLRRAAHLWAQEPIDFRAWSFQERILSTRTISFRSQEAALEWKCDSVQETDAGACDSYEGIKKNWLFDELLKNTRYNEPALNRLCFKWAELIENYSARQLTYASDRLPAVGGIAQEMECSQLGDYAAGLWQGLLPTNLLWNVTDDTRVKEPDGSSNVPSWSWASVVGQVSMPHALFPTDRLHARLLSMDMTLADTSLPFGQLRRGGIQLEGYTRKIVIKHDKIWDCAGGTPIGRALLDSPTSIAQLDALCLLVVEEGYDEDASTPTSATSQNLPSHMEGLILVTTTIASELKRIGTFCSQSGAMALPTVAPEAWTLGDILIV